MLVEKFVNRTEFSSYDDFYNNFELKVPDNFNFAFDVIDELAEKIPDGRAMIWLDDRGDYREFTFAQLKECSDRTAAFFRSMGIGKGDMVMLILQRRYEWWFSMIALHRLGAVCIPATHMLTKEDIVFRNNAAEIKMILAVNDGDIPSHVESAMPDSPTVKHLVMVGGKRDGWISFEEGFEKAAPEKFERVTENSDISLIYFTSGTTNHPKMVAHDFLYPLGHIVTGFFWHNVRPGGIHLTVADTGWGKAVWGKFYGQWISEGTVFVYDYHARFQEVKRNQTMLHNRYLYFPACLPDTEIQDNILLCSPYNLPLPYPGGSFRVRPFFPAALHHSRRASFRRGIQPLEADNRAQHQGGLRTDRNHSFSPELCGRFHDQAGCGGKTGPLLQDRNP